MDLALTLNALSGPAKQSLVAHAARRLSINEKKRNPETEFVPVPEGQALFIFSPENKNVEKGV